MPLSLKPFPSVIPQVQSNQVARIFRDSVSNDSQTQFPDFRSSVPPDTKVGNLYPTYSPLFLNTETKISNPNRQLESLVDEIARMQRQPLPG